METMVSRVPILIYSNDDLFVTMVSEIESSSRWFIPRLWAGEAWASSLALMIMIGNKLYGAGGQANALAQLISSLQGHTASDSPGDGSFPLRLLSRSRGSVIVRACATHAIDEA